MRKICLASGEKRTGAYRNTTSATISSSAMSASQNRSLRVVAKGIARVRSFSGSS